MIGAGQGKFLTERLRRRPRFDLDARQRFTTKPDFGLRTGNRSRAPVPNNHDSNRALRLSPQWYLNQKRHDLREARLGP